MFLHSGASLHGHEYNTPSTPQSPQQRNKPFLRSAIPPPILRSSSSVDRPFSPPARSAIRRRPVSELFLRPRSDLLPAAAAETARLSAPSTPVVRFKDPDVEKTPTAATSMTEEEENRSLCESDVSQATASTAQRRSRRPSPRSSTVYLLAQPAPSSINQKTLLKTIRPKLLLQLQELAPNRRPRPTVDVFPAALIAGPLVAARYIHRSPRLFGDKGELGPRDLVLVRSEDYTAEDDEDDDSYANRRQPIAVLSPGRGPADTGELVLENGNRWKWTNQRGNYSFVHVDEHGVSCTVRWVKRSASTTNTTNRESSIFIPGAGGPSCLPASPPLGSDSGSSSEYRYTFSIINPLVRRHPVLATLGPQSLEIYDDYTTPSSSSGKYPPTRPVSGAWDAAVRDAAPVPVEGSTTGRETYTVDEKTKDLIRMTALCLTLRLGPSRDAIDSFPEPQFLAQDSPASTTSSRCSITIMPRRQTTGNMMSAPPSAASLVGGAQPPQPKGLRRAMSTGAAFMMQRKKRQQQEAASTCNIISERDVARTASPSGSKRDASSTVDNSPPRAAPAAAVVVVMEEGITGAAAGPATATVQQKQARRVSWLRKLTH
ncbi:hypothetical protein BD289DRAFT_453396 [Coniella lustricola]|uniref:Uncharacterized protein n=1 Tax=Coniella lustricola TaxID=2025994 RepID=A0A2T3A7J0_9PEZI|nr:hypothetical protein BD289DRAFT_453396 [Coniella lustricola]